MNDDFSTRRRQLLRGAGVGGTALLAGCSEQLGLSQNDNNSTDGGSGDGERRVGVVAAVDQQALQELQVEMQQKMQSENASQQEVQQEYQQRQQELIGQAIDSLTGELGSSVTVQEQYNQLGAVVISGPPSALLDALELDAAQSLVLASEVEAAAQSSQTANSTNSTNSS